MTENKLINIGLLQESEYDKWDAFVKNHPQATIYHALAWKKVTEEGFGHKAFYLRALDSSSSIAGILPLFLITGFFGRRLVSMPMRDRGGVISLSPDVTKMLIEHAVSFTKELNCKYLEMRSFQKLPEEIASEQSLTLTNQWITTRLDISKGKENVWKNLDRKSARQAVNKAVRLGSRVILDNSQQGINLFYTLFVRTRMKMGIPPFPKNLFVSIWTHLIQKGHANLFIAWHEDKPINGMINLLFNDTILPAYAAPQNEWRKFNSSDIMIWQTIEWAIENNFKTYDFGADSHLQKSLLNYKSKWGGVQNSMNYYYWLNGIDKPVTFDSSSPTNVLIRNIWQRLPIVIGRPVGAWLTRQLS